MSAGRSRFVGQSENAASAMEPVMKSLSNAPSAATRGEGDNSRSICERQMRVMIDGLNRLEKQIVNGRGIPDLSVPFEDCALVTELKNALDDVRTAIWCLEVNASAGNAEDIRDLLDRIRMQRVVDMLRKLDRRTRQIRPVSGSPVRDIRN